MNGTSAKKGATSQRFYGCAYNENGTNVRRADGEIDKMHEKDVVTKTYTYTHPHTHIPEGRRRKILGVVHLRNEVNIGSLSTRRLYYIYAAGPTHGETSTRDRTKLNENEIRENGRNNKHTYIPKRVSFKDT